MDVCREVVPPEVIFPDGVRVACHLHPAGREGARRSSARTDVAARRGIAVRRPLAAPMPSDAPPAVAS